ncbi:hypothetical protein HDV00_008308 [Rhizophlyctis rosea]|nr:hypothetical protein HDV00_008308 [Rhizophlyctis rosea]
MRTPTHLITLLAVSLFAPAHAFEGTSPLIVWSNQPFKAVSSPTVLRRDEIHPAILDPIGCRKVNVIFNQQDLHASDLSRLSTSLPFLKRAVSDAASSVEVPYVSGAHGVPTSVVDGVSSVCQEGNGKQVVVIPIEDDTQLPALEEGASYIFTTTLPSFRFSGAETDAMSKSDHIIADIMAKIQAITEDWVAMYTSAGPVVVLHKRADTTATTTPYSKRSVFQKYVFFNSALFMCIGAIAPIIIIGLIGVKMLTTLQTPDRFDNPRKDK